MWTDRKPAHSPSLNPNPSSHAPHASEGVASTSGVTVIGPNMVVRGSIRSKESLHIDGEVDGSLELPDYRLTVGSNGRVGADTTAREVEILGRLEGDIDAEKKITIRKGGRLIGDLRTPAIVIEEGAYFKGRIEIVNAETRPQIVSQQVHVRKTATGD